jgi:hypothetical protein
MLNGEKISTPNPPRATAAAGIRYSPLGRSNCARGHSTAISATRTGSSVGCGRIQLRHVPFITLISQSPHRSSTSQNRSPSWYSSIICARRRHRHRDGDRCRITSAASYRRTCPDVHEIPSGNTSASNGQSACPICSFQHGHLREDVDGQPVNGVHAMRRRGAMLKCVSFPAAKRDVRGHETYRASPSHAADR